MPEAVTDAPTRARLAILAGVVALVAVVDQATKTWALHHLATRPIHLFWTLRLNLSFNSGAAFGLGAGLGPFILVGAALLVVVFFVVGRHSLTKSLLLTIALGLVLGGAVGNLIDRLVRDNGGAVIDFIDLQWWPIFNLADAAISVGAVLLVAAGRRHA